MCEKRFQRDGYVYDDCDNYVPPIDDDYEFWKAEQESLTAPLSDDYCKYDCEQN